MHPTGKKETRGRLAGLLADSLRGYPIRVTTLAYTIWDNYDFGFWTGEVHPRLMRSIEPLG